VEAQEAGRAGATTNSKVYSSLGFPTQAAQEKSRAEEVQLGTAAGSQAGLVRPVAQCPQEELVQVVQVDARLGIHRRHRAEADCRGVLAAGSAAVVLSELSDLHLGLPYTHHRQEATASPG